MKRLSIYFFYDNDGIVDDYVFYALEKLKAFSKEMIFVVNGQIKEEYNQKLKKVVDHIYFRQNSGLDACAYKYAFEKYGYDNLAKFDEIILTNFTSFGPIYPLSDLFGTMDKRSCDFWGIAKHPQKINIDGNESVIHHVQSFFVVYRKQLFSSPEFKQYWDSLPEISSYNDSVFFHELRQTPFFEHLGFTSDSYVDIEKYKEDFDINAVIQKADKQLIEDKSPFLKRRNFFLDRGRITNIVVLSLLEYINKHTDYDLKLINDNITRTQNVDLMPEKFKYRIRALKYILFSKIFFFKKAHYLEKLRYLKIRNMTKFEFEKYLKGEN